MTAAWMVRASDPAEVALGEGVVFAGWPNLGDISSCRSHAELKERLREVAPNDSNQRLGNHVGQLWRFLKQMQPRDLVAMPLRSDPDRMAVGRIVGRYRYRCDAPAGFRHIRAVDWINAAVRRDAPQADLRHSLGSIVTICRLPSDPEGRRLAAMARGEPDPGPTPRAEDVSGSPYVRDLMSVVDVGDGACIVIRTRRDGRDSVTVIDCGSDSISADDACDRLLDAIDGTPELIETIVVTHFDADHYRGFVRLAQRMGARGQRFRSLRLISPRPPDVEPSYTAAYLAMATTVTGLRSLDLVQELQGVTVGRFRYTPLARGAGGAFLAGGCQRSENFDPLAL